MTQRRRHKAPSAEVACPAERGPSPLRAALGCRCPRCGRGALFAGYLKLADRCPICGLDFGFADPADGPAFFVMSAVGVVVIGAWAWWAFVARPAIWLQLAVVPLAMTVGCLGLLRPVKAWLVAEQYHRIAGEGGWASLGAHGDGGFTKDRRAASEGRTNAPGGVSAPAPTRPRAR